MRKIIIIIIAFLVTSISNAQSTISPMYRPTIDYGTDHVYYKDIDNDYNHLKAHGFIPMATQH